MNAMASLSMSPASASAALQHPSPAVTAAGSCARSTPRTGKVRLCRPVLAAHQDSSSASCCHDQEYSSPKPASLWPSFLPSRSAVLALAAAAAVLISPSGLLAPAALAADTAAQPFQQYFGTAASASSYGGYGGNASKRDTAEYVYDVPQGWKERLISKVEKGTNGTDSEFYNPRRKDEKVYLTFLPGFRRLAPRDNVLNNLALSDVSLQDIIASADNIQASDKTDPKSGQLYYDYEIDSPVAHSLISVTCSKNKLYAHFVNAPAQLWASDEPMLRHVHESFTTLGGNPLEPVL